MTVEQAGKEMKARLNLVA